MTINSMLKTLSGNYYTEVTYNGDMCMSADTAYLRALAKGGDPRTKLEIRNVYMDIFHQVSTGENMVHMHIDLKGK